MSGVEVHGHSHAGGGASTITSLALPAFVPSGQVGAQLGDLLILVATVGSHSGAWSLSVTDPRFTLLRELDAPAAPNGDLWSQGGVWYGYATTLDPIILNADPGTAATDVAKVACIALKARVDTTRVSTVTATANSYTLPSLPGENDGAVVAIVGRMGSGEAALPTPAGIYTIQYQGDLYCKVALGYTTTPGVIGSQAVAWDEQGTGGVIRTNNAVIALRAVPTAAPPGRLFPRDDDLGVGSGRHFPPPKSQQRSGRRFGYY